MSAITISAERASKVHSVVHNFVSTFAVAPVSQEEALNTLKDVYHPDVEWYDHAFLVCRKGHEAVVGLQRSFNHCNDPFKVDIKAIIPTATGAILEQVWVGNCSNDIVRPDGQVVVKASGKDFKCHVCMVIAIDENGKVTRIDEYYNKKWDDGIPETDYTVMKGASMKRD